MTLPDSIDDQVALASSLLWLGPFPEVDHNGRPTGHLYIQCRDCGIEVLEQDREHATHRSTCPNAITPGIDDHH